MSDAKMTEYSHRAGCRCKISPAVLDVMLKSQLPAMSDASLLVGNGQSGTPDYCFLIKD